MAANLHMRTESRRGKDSASRVTTIGTPPFAMLAMRTMTKDRAEILRVIGHLVKSNSCSTAPTSGHLTNTGVAGG